MVEGEEGLQNLAKLKEIRNEKSEEENAQITRARVERRRSCGSAIPFSQSTRP